MRVRWVLLEPPSSRSSVPLRRASLGHTRPSGLGPRPLALPQVPPHPISPGPLEGQRTRHLVLMVLSRGRRRGPSTRGWHPSSQPVPSGRVPCDRPSAGAETPHLLPRHPTVRPHRKASPSPPAHRTFLHGINRPSPGRPLTMAVPREEGSPARRVGPSPGWGCLVALPERMGMGCPPQGPAA